MSDHKVIGYVSIMKDKSGIFTDQDACVVAGTDESMNCYIETESSISCKDQEIKKTRLKEILRGIDLGAKYQFDSISYDRFIEALKAKYNPQKLSVIEVQKEHYDSKFYNVEMAQN